MKTSASRLSRWFDHQDELQSTVLLQCPEAVGADIHLLFSTLVEERPFIDIGHKAPVSRVLGVTHAVTIHRTLTADLASLCHLVTPLDNL
jgi:hypothetical protein